MDAANATSRIRATVLKAAQEKASAAKAAVEVMAVLVRVRIVMALSPLGAPLRQCFFLP